MNPNISKPIINRSGYILPKCITTVNQQNMIKNDLCVTPFIKNGFTEPEPFNVYRHDAENYYLPRFWGLKNITDDVENGFKYNSNSSADFKFDKFSLRKEQVIIINTMIDYFIDKKTGTLKPFMGKIINIGTGMGKTVLALLLMCFLKRKAILITHTEPLEVQWLERIESYVTGAKLGYIKGKKYKIDGCNIVIVKVQSLMKSQLPLEELLKDFDTVIYDETHHYASKVFSNVLARLAVPYNIALTATFERKDKLERVLNWYLGDIGYKISGQLDYDIEIDVIRFGKKGDKQFRECTIPGQGLNIGKMMTNLTLIDERNNAIIEKIEETLCLEPERHLLLISHRLDHIFVLQERLEKIYPGQIGIIIGKKGQKKITDEDVKQVIGKKIIIGIYNLVKEGVDIATICSVWLLTPMSDALQCCGRMLRRKKHMYIHRPKIVEFMDQMNIYKGMHFARLRQYKESYLQSEFSSLTYYDCNDETNFKINLGHVVNLKEFAMKEAKVKADPMESDDE
jgi:hypothetical protein